MKVTKPGWLKILIKPRILIPILLTGALLSFAFSIGDLPKALGHIRSLPLLNILEAFGLAFGYLAIKAKQFNFLLNKLGIRTSWKEFLLAYCIGEMALLIPSGIYAQNYVLQRIYGEKFGLSSAATTMALAIEGALVVLSFLVLKIPHWGWLQYFSLSVVGVGTLLLLSLMRSHRLRNWLARKRTGWREKIFGAVRDLLDGLRILAAPHILFPSVLLSVVYLSFLISAFFIVGKGVGMTGLTWEQSLTIYFFSLGVTLTFGWMMTQLGVIEVAGLGASQAWGYTFTEGLAMLLGFRIVWMGSIWLMNGLVAWSLRDEFRGSTPDHREKSTD